MYRLATAEQMRDVRVPQAVKRDMRQLGGGNVARL
jgi:hypothetical protein